MKLFRHFALAFAMLLAPSVVGAQMLQAIVNFGKPRTAAYVGPLDAISGGAAATVVACWALRACSAAIANALTKAFNVKKSGGTTSDITVLANGNFDTATAVTFCAGGSITSCSVNKTYDQTSNANHLTPFNTSTESSFATTATCGINTAPCVFMNGDSGPGVLNPIGASFTDPMTMSWVQYYKCSSCAGFGEAISLRASGSFSCDSGHNNSINHAFSEGSSLFTATMSDNQWHAVQATVTNGASASVLNVDGTETTGTTNHCNATPSVMVGWGTNPPSGGTSWSGYLVEAILFSSALSSADRTALCKNQQAYYGKTNFPANC